MAIAPDAVWKRSDPAVRRSMRRLIVAHARGAEIEAAAARNELANEVAGTRFLANMLGREWMWRAGRRAMRFGALRSVRTSFKVPLVPSAPTPEAAVDALMRRTPAIAHAADDVARVVQAHGIAFARSASLNITKRIQAIIGNALMRGFDREDAVAEIVANTGWADSYANTVFRTNAIGAYSDGTRDQARITDGIEGLEFSATGDSDTRPNHMRADGFAARTADPIWDAMKPPLGYNCRCALIPVTTAQAMRRFGRDGIPFNQSPPAGSGPDEGFRK